MRKEDRPLNKLTVKEYLEDYLLYRKCCEEDGRLDQVKLDTYLSEFEHQEGPINPIKKKALRRKVAKWYITDMQRMVDTIMEDTKAYVLDAMNDTSKSDEDIKDYVEGKLHAITYGIEEGGY
jgi:hypothetical protein